MRYTDDKHRIWVEDNRLPQGWCYEEDHPFFQPAAIGITSVAATAEVAADDADRANDKANSMRLQALAAANEATALHQEAADRAQANLADAQALVDTATGKAKVQEEKAALAQEASKFDAETFAARDAMIVGAGPTLAATLMPTAPLLPPADEQALQPAASPARTQRTLVSSLLPSATWYPGAYMPSCLGGANGGQPSLARGSRDLTVLTSRRRRRKLKVNDE